MKEATSTKKHVQITAEEGGISALTLGNAKIEVSADGKTVTAYTNDGVETKAALDKDTLEVGQHTEDDSVYCGHFKGAATKISIRNDFNAVVLNGVTIEQAANGHLVITAPGGTVINKPAAANDTAIAAAQAALKIGDEIRENGVVTAIYAGRTADGKLILTMPTDLDVPMTFNDAAKAVEKLNDKNTLGHNDWQIPVLENVRVMQKNQNEGKLKGTFNTTNKKGSGSDYPGWHWSSTPGRDYPTYVGNVRFSDGNEFWDLKDSIRLSCRPVRLVAASAPSLG